MGNNQSVSSSSADFAHSSNGSGVPNNILFGSSLPFIENDDSIFDDCKVLTSLKKKSYFLDTTY
jgi:hypothetical protein